MTGKGQSPPTRVFTTYSLGKESSLKNEVGVSQASQPGQPLPPSKKFIGLYDTGATGTSVSLRLVKELGLKPIRMAKSHGISGARDCYVYLVNITLPNKVMIGHIPVYDAELPPQFDLLIGMDIIGLGDFAVSNYNGRTVFSFRIPSEGDIDFLAGRDKVKIAPPVASNAAPLMSSKPPGRNDPCHCGSGIKYKKCHGPQGGLNMGKNK